MENIILDGKATSKDIIEELKQKNDNIINIETKKKKKE